jgi:hypothetical protein
LRYSAPFSSPFTSAHTILIACMRARVCVCLLVTVCCVCVRMCVCVVCVVRVVCAVCVCRCNNNNNNNRNTCTCLCRVRARAVFEREWCLSLLLSSLVCCVWVAKHAGLLQLPPYVVRYTHHSPSFFYYLIMHMFWIARVYVVVCVAAVKTVLCVCRRSFL